MIKTYVNGQENGVITFKGDTEPCAVYVNGEKQDNISYVPQEVTGETSVSYSSEYKKNVRTMQIDGNTEQYQRAGGDELPLFDLKDWNDLNLPQLEAPDLGTTYTSCIYWSLPINYEQGVFELWLDYMETLSDQELNIVIAYTTDDLINRTGSYQVLYPYTKPVYVDQPFYIGAINPNGYIDETDGTMWQNYINAIFDESVIHFITVDSPSPYAPSPIQNAGNVNPNLFDIDNPSYVYHNATGKNYTMKISDGIISSGGVSAVSSGQCFKIDVSNKSNVTISFNAEYDKTTQIRTIIDVRGINEIGTDNIAVDFKSLIPEASAKIVNGTNSFTVDVTNYNYLAIAFISNTRYGIKITNLQVKSGNSNYIECVLRGANLFDISQVKGGTLISTSNPNVSAGVAYGSVTDGVLRLVYGAYAGTILWAGAKIPINKAGNYYISCDVFVDETSSTSQIYARLANKSKNIYTTQTFSPSLEKGKWVRYTFPAITVNEDWVGDDIYLSLSSVGNASQYTNMPNYAKNIMVAFENDTGVYEPYFHKTLSLPSSVNVDGQEVQLRFGKVDKADYISVDRVNRTVKYIRNIAYLKLPHANDIYTYFNMKGVQFSDAAEQFLARAKGFCTHTNRVGNYVGEVSKNAIWVGVNQKYIYWIGILDILGLTTKDEFNSWLDEQNTKGTPVEVLYELRTPIEYVLYDKANNITTELGQQILDFVNSTQNATNIIEITSTPSVSNLSVNYAKWGGAK